MKNPSPFKILKLHNQDAYKEKCLEALRQNHMRITEARLTILDFLANSQEALSVQDIFISVSRKVKTKPDRASVYRVLSLLESLNLVHRISPNGHYLACFHLACNHSWHVVMQCQSCQKTRDVVFSDRFSKLLESELQDQNFITKATHLLQVQGICRSCSK